VAAALFGSGRQWYNMTAVVLFGSGVAVVLFGQQSGGGMI